jgi:hypothetical protein
MCSYTHKSSFSTQIVMKFVLKIDERIIRFLGECDISYDTGDAIRSYIVDRRFDGESMLWFTYCVFIKLWDAKIGPESLGQPLNAK